MSSGRRSRLIRPRLVGPRQTRIHGAAVNIPFRGMTPIRPAQPDHLGGSMRRVIATWLPVALAAVAVVVIPASTAFAAAGPPECWVSWRPSEGSISFTNTGKSDTLMTFRLKWRREDLIFRTCRQRTAFELETFFSTSNNRNKLGNFKIQSTDLPRAYIDSDRERNPREVTFGIGSADDLVGDRWYSLVYLFNWP